MSLTPIARPQLAPDLQERVRQVLAGPSRYAGAPGTDDPGFRLANQARVEFHADAERDAAQLRASRQHRIGLAGIIEWLEPLTVMVAKAPDAAKLRAYAAVIAVSDCAQFPLPVWQDALPEAVTAFDYWPTGKELKRLLERYDAAQLAELRALDVIAKATTHAPRGPAREAKGYDPGPAPPPHAPHPSMPKHDPAADLVRIDAASVDAQLAALGYTRDTVPPLKPREVKP